MNAPFPLTPSALWSQAAGIPASGPLWGRDTTRCVMCGATVGAHSHGVPVTQDLIDAGFNAKLDCHFAGHAVCGHCQSLWTNQWLQSDSKSYAVAGEGVFKLARADDIARFVIDPPKSAYVAIFNTRQQAHMIWRTPVALPSQHILQVRLDDELLMINRARVLAAVPAWQASLRILKACGKPKSQVFLNSYDLATSMVGVPLGKNAQIVREHSPEGAAAMDALFSLSMADWWALCAVRDHDPECLTPERTTAPVRRPVATVVGAQMDVDVGVGMEAESA